MYVHMYTHDFDCMNDLFSPPLAPSALGLAFQPLGSSGVVWSPIKLELNLYTGPGFLSALLLIINFILIIILFRECRIFTEVKKIPKCLKCLCCRCMCCRRESLIEDDSKCCDVCVRPTSGISLSVTL